MSKTYLRTSGRTSALPLPKAPARGHLKNSHPLENQNLGTYLHPPLIATTHHASLQRSKNQNLHTVIPQVSPPTQSPPSCPQGRPQNTLRNILRNSKPHYPTQISPDRLHNALPSRNLRLLALEPRKETSKNLKKQPAKPQTYHVDAKKPRQAPQCSALAQSSPPCP